MTIFQVGYGGVRGHNDHEICMSQKRMTMMIEAHWSHWRREGHSERKTWAQQHDEPSDFVALRKPFSDISHDAKTPDHLPCYVIYQFNSFS
jgi:hypothetical protein